MNNHERTQVLAFLREAEQALENALFHAGTDPASDELDRRQRIADLARGTREEYARTFNTLGGRA